MCYETLCFPFSLSSFFSFSDSIGSTKRQAHRQRHAKLSLRAFYPRGGPNLAFSHCSCSFFILLSNRLSEAMLGFALRYIYRGTRKGIYWMVHRCTKTVFHWVDEQHDSHDYGGWAFLMDRTGVFSSSAFVHLAASWEGVDSRRRSLIMYQFSITHYTQDALSVNVELSITTPASQPASHPWPRGPATSSVT